MALEWAWCVRVGVARWSGRGILIVKTKFLEWAWHLKWAWQTFKRYGR